jgi:peptidoglycan/LPS O-acetylase OafA/YrhL
MLTKLSIPVFGILMCSVWLFPIINGWAGLAAIALLTSSAVVYYKTLYKPSQNLKRRVSCNCRLCSVLNEKCDGVT